MTWTIQRGSTDLVVYNLFNGEKFVTEVFLPTQEEDAGFPRGGVRVVELLSPQNHTHQDLTDFFLNQDGCLAILREFEEWSNKPLRRTRHD